MRIVPLSDHPSALLRQAQQRRAAADTEIQQAYTNWRASWTVAAGSYLSFRRCLLLLAAGG